MTDNNKKRTLAIDIGGSKVKMLVLNEHGEAITSRTWRETPYPAVPAAVVNAIEEQLKDHGDFDRISIGFPGVVKNGIVKTAVNLHENWHEYNLEHTIINLTSKPVKVANDADIQGFGVIKGQGVELVITLGTGFGSSLFTDGVLVPNLELGHHLFENHNTYEQALGKAAKKAAGKELWQGRLLRAIQELDELFNPTRIYIGGGNAKKVKIDLPEHVEITHNIAGLLGGIRLWDH